MFLTVLLVSLAASIALVLFVAVVVWAVEFMSELMPVPVAIGIACVIAFTAVGVGSYYAAGLP